MTFYNVISSPIGELTISANDEYITGLHIEGDRYFSLPDDWRHMAKHSLLQQFEKELKEYFEGNRTAFDVSMSYGGTQFQRSVWGALCTIPSGQTTSYKDLAETIGKPRAIRAVGTAIGRNPLCIIVPCHRVVVSDGSLGGYVAGLERKQWLLEHEK